MQAQHLFDPTINIATVISAAVLFAGFWRAHKQNQDRIREFAEEFTQMKVQVQLMFETWKRDMRKRSRDEDGT